MLKQNVETLQQTWRSSLEAATSQMGRSSQQFSRTLGLSEEDAQKETAATERSARNAQTLLYSGTAAAKLMGECPKSTSRWFVNNLRSTSST
ncbi:hypothetical protein [Bradyrhizobium sp. ERR14]|uniref:hypothetical protein n=1 Tax=Bradyrhizobium sp. ERR14 TaxID=2663837 RepID=UPI001616F5BD|nr:hypothetical protein [Bradyrhizobium sp. ERR14]MBB4392458.1 hypothetical protein [Bradyrhizobium sp. ERR14]